VRIDLLAERFGAEPGRIALVGLSLGGYCVTRAAGHETRLATVIASTPFPNPATARSPVIRGQEYIGTLYFADGGQFRGGRPSGSGWANVEQFFACFASPINPWPTVE
jgi:hypothetical protein